jgi:3-deoxy-7-phosphoheptulonate synthase
VNKIILLKNNCTDSDLQKIIGSLNHQDFDLKVVRTQSYQFIVIANEKTGKDLSTLIHNDYVEQIFDVPDSYPLVSKLWKQNETVIELSDDIKIGSNNFTFIAGPCSIEDESQIDKVISHLVENKIGIVRGGAFKPRTSPYSFQGQGLESLKIFHQKASKAGIKVISEVPEISLIQSMYPYVDIFQVGARNSQNYRLLSALGEVDKPVLIKRGLAGTLDELLLSAEYVFASGNEKILLCERGIRSYEHSYRNTLDINAIPFLKQKTHLPVIVDPSHGIGIRNLVPSVALAAIAAGADGVMIEVHPTPDSAKSDGAQTLDFSQASQLYRKGRRVVDALYE